MGLGSSKGMSLIEAMIAIAILAIAGMALNAIMVNSANLNSKLSIEDTFQSFLTDFQENINYDDRCDNILRAALGTTPILPQIELVNDPRNPYAIYDASGLPDPRNPYAPIPKSTGAPKEIPIDTFTFRGNDYVTKNPAQNYIYANPSNRMHVRRLVLNSPPKVPERRKILVGGVYVPVDRYETTLSFYVDKDMNGTVEPFGNPSTLNLNVMLDPTTKQMLQCVGSGGVPGACMAVGGDYSSANPAGSRCDLRPLSGGCSNGGQWVARSQTDTSQKYCDTKNPSMDKCECPTGFATFHTMTFEGLDDAGKRWFYNVYSCMNCTDTQVQPVLTKINVIQ
jgi:prepilin-type N-terminal cleavage/methylation domain-containing protein